MTAIQDLFARDIHRNIAPVVYFHDQDPDHIAAEVSEYIVTGGFNPGDPQALRVPQGIHEQYVRLLRNLRRELDRPEGADLPASWISGFFGSGKSSFAKLLGLALDGLQLPDGRSLGDALVARDDSPRAAELQAAWEALSSGLDSIAVVFDIGSRATSGERIHTVVRRALQTRLGYCGYSAVAEYELRLERDGRWDDLLRAVEDAEGQSWAELKGSSFADETFSAAMHRLFPDRYTDPLSWLDTHGGSQGTSQANVEDTTRDIRDMLDARAPGKTLFVVIDEVSQYIHQDDNQMLALQSFIADLGQRLKGRVWLLATGQQKLEDDDPNLSIGKLKDRFPPHLRVHLDPTNIRDVVHKRLLQKSPEGAATLHQLLKTHRASLQLHALGGQELRADEIVETYPLLPGQIDLLLEITSAIRTRSSRAQGDAQAIRGLLQLVGELFRVHTLGARDAGHLVTLDLVFEILRSALDNDTQNTLALLFSHPLVQGSPIAARVVRAVALLELLQDRDRWRTSHELVAASLYPRIGDPPNHAEVRDTLDRLAREGLLGYSEQRGFKLMSSAGQDWQRERDRLHPSEDERHRSAVELLTSLLSSATPPKLQKQPFPWHGLFTDERRYHAHTLRRAPAQGASLTVHLYWITEPERRQIKLWISQSLQQPHVLHWLIDKELDTLGDQLSELIRSRAMLERYDPRFNSLPHERQHLVQEERTRCDVLNSRVRDALTDAFIRGTAFHNGRCPEIPQGRPLKEAFKDALEALGEDILPQLYAQFIPIQLKDDELRQLIQREPAGVSSLLLDHPGLGILSLDGGRYNASCKGQAPSGIKRFIHEQQRVTGADLLQTFSGPPWGYSGDVIRASLLGLLRAQEIVAQSDVGDRITAPTDPGVEDLFVRNKGFARVTFGPATEGALTVRERRMIASFFQSAFGVGPEPDNEALADAAFQHLPRLRARLNSLRDRATGLPVQLPEALNNLQRAIDEASASRQIEPTVRATFRALKDLQAGLDALKPLEDRLTPEAVARLQRARLLLDTHAAQLRAVELHAPAQSHIDALQAALDHPQPWAATDDLDAHLDALLVHYQTERYDLIQRHIHDLERTLLRLQQHEGFARLSPDKAAQLRLTIERAAFDTNNNETRPGLDLLRDAGPTRLQAALDEALRRLDAYLLPPDFKIREVALQPLLNNRTLETRADVEDLLTELRSLLFNSLQPNTRLRLK